MGQQGVKDGGLGWEVLRQVRTRASSLMLVGEWKFGDSGLGW